MTWNSVSKATSKKKKKSGFTCTLPPWGYEVNFHAANNTSRASQLSSQNGNPVTRPPVHLTPKTYGSWLINNREYHYVWPSPKNKWKLASEVLTNAWLWEEIFMDYIVRDILSIHYFRWHFKLCPQIKLEHQRLHAWTIWAQSQQKCFNVMPWLSTRVVMRKQ